MKNLSLLIIFTLSFQFAQSQKEAWNWNFGNHAGINFSSGSPVSFSGTAINQMEGSASISDSFGNLLFYTDGISVYTASNTLMPNGTGLMGDNSSSTSAIIIKQPGSNSIFYLFTVDFNHDGLAIGNGFRYSIIDMTLNGGNGDVTVKNELIRLPVYEKLTAVKHANANDFWVIVNDWTTDDILSYKLDSTGLDTNLVASNVGPIHFMNAAHTTGCMKASPQGDKLALALWAKRSFELFDYDNSTGIASNHLTVLSNDMNWAYGVEFSPDGSKLYGSKLSPPSSLYQFDISVWDTALINSSRVTLATSPNSYIYCALQLAPDNKIYCSISANDSLGVISDPNINGTGCNFSRNGVSLGTALCRYGLPNFVSSYLLPTKITQPNLHESFSVYPNPTIGYLHLRTKLKTDDYSFRLFDFTGKEIRKGKIPNPSFALDLSDLTNGIYELQILNDVQKTSKKIIIQK